MESAATPLWALTLAYWLPGSPAEQTRLQRQNTWLLRLNLLLSVLILALTALARSV